MYSGFAFSNASGDFLGVHQKFDRVAYRQLQEILSTRHLSVDFPNIASILHFEGRNGPDGLKVKSPGHCEPRHFYDPYNPLSTDLLTYLRQHQQALWEALVDGNLEKAAWEAAWLSHVIVDGLTPAHHFPYDEEMRQVFDGQRVAPIKMTDKVWLKARNVQGSDRRLASIWSKLLVGNWRLWGHKGLLLTHVLFEMGVALIVKPAFFHHKLLARRDWRFYRQRGFIRSFQATALRIADRRLYQRFYLWGWTPRLAWQVREFLAPTIIKFIILAWLEAIFVAEATLRKKQELEA